MSRVFIAVALMMFISSCTETNEELVDRAIAYKQAGKYKEAIEIYSSIIKKNGKLQLPYYNRGLTYFAIKDYPKALADFNRVMSLQQVGTFIFTYNSDSPYATEEARSQVPYNDALYLRAQVLYEMDSITSSHRDFRRLIEQNYERSDCLVWQGLCWVKGGDTDKACAKFAEAKKCALTADETKEAQKFIQEYCNK